MIRVLIVDDQEMIRAGLRTILSTNAQLDIVATASDGFEALAVLENQPVDVVLMDIRMPGIDGVETTRRIRSAPGLDSVRIVVLTTFDNDENVLAAIRAGANGFLSKGAGPDEIADAIGEVMNGGGALSAAASATLIKHVSTARHVEVDLAAAQRFAALTPRERQSVIEVVAGLDNAQIAAKLFLSPLTVKTHVNRAMAKVGVRDRAQLVSLAYRAGLTS